MVKIKRSLISVYDKTGLAEFVKGLKELGIEIISTGGTADFIKSQGIEVKSVQDLTGFPEILGGRVKTLHPKIHGAILSLRESHAHIAETRSHGIEMIDMVVANLYPFAQVITKPNVGMEEALENIDIGGTTLLRSAAKNYNSVAVVCNPARYAALLSEMKAQRGLIMDETLASLAVEAFKITAEYDKAINEYLGRKILPLQQRPQQIQQVVQQPVQEQVQAQPQQQPPAPSPEPIAPSPTPLTTEPSGFPETFNISLKKSQDLRYGENPHQKGAFYKDKILKEASVSSAKQLQGKQLSFCNIMDLDAALEIVKEFEKPAVSIIKHTNPCGVAVADTLPKAFNDALDGDRTSAYGGIIGLNRQVDANTADAIIGSGFIECIIAPGYEAGALEKFKTRQNTRILEVPAFNQAREAAEYSMRKVTGGMLIQERDLKTLDTAQLRIVTKKKPTAEEVDSLLFAWKIVKYVKSNAIVLARGTKTVGIGAGQMSRVDAVYIAAYKADRNAKASVLASDAFFPKADGVELAARAGVTAIIQPGGSKADEEIIRTADKRGLCMVFTGMRHFRH